MTSDWCAFSWPALSPLKGPPRQLPCLFSLCSFYPGHWFSAKTCHNYLRQCISSLGRHSRIGREWAKEGKDCTKSSQAIHICLHTTVKNHFFVKESYLTTPMSPTSTPLVHIILLIEICCQNQPTKHTSVLLQRNLTISNKVEEDTTFDLIILFFGNIREMFLYVSTRRHAKMFTERLKDWESLNNLNIHQQYNWF